jgi:predicted phage terminase large subunit-like protein
MIFCPPGHGKSELISQYLPCVFLGRNPDKRVLFASYEASYAAGWGRKARNVMEDVGEEVWGIKIDPGSSAVDRWDILNHRGGLQTGGIGGPFTGKRANLLIIDDPIKNQQEAYSATYRDRNWEWWCSTWETRAEPGAARVLIMTRWHEDDLAGRLLRDQSDRWRVVSMPALAEAGDPLDRVEGEALWPERWPEELLNEKRQTVGKWVWNAEYQQRPAPDEGVIFKRVGFRYYSNSGGAFKLRPDPKEWETTKEIKCADCWRFTTVDLAASVKSSADFTVATTFAVTPQNDLIILDVQRQRMEGPDQIDMLWRIYKQQNPGYFAIEKNGYQLVLVQGAVRSGLPVRAITVDKDKISRALPAAARVESGSVYFPETAAWLSDFESELLSFPHAAHDDQVDTLSAAVAEVARRGMVRFG